MGAIASNAGSLAILKRRYPDGKLPKANYATFPAMAMLAKKEDFVGDDRVLALQTEDPQGFGPTVSQAQASSEQGAYRRFLLQRIELFGVARIKGQALRTATQRGGGALVDLWTNEMDGISRTTLKRNETYWFGNGSGVLATIASGSATPTITLTVAEDVNNIDFGSTLGAVDDTSLSPTVRVGSGKVTAIDRTAGTVTASANWNTLIAGLIDGDSLIYAGTAAVGGVSVVPTGLRQWLIGGNSPGTLFQLDRDPDPTRTASQSFDATGIPMEDAIIDLESLITNQGQMSEKVLWCHPRDLRQLKKSLSGKVTFPREKMSSSIAGISFEAIQFEGDYSTIKLLPSPFCPRFNAFMTDMNTAAQYSAGAYPMVLDFDGPEFLRVSTDDAYEVRVGGYEQFGIDAPVKSARMSGWGE